MSKQWTAADIPALDGKRFFITGANSGIGYAAALQLLRHGAAVTLACRDAVRGQAAVARLLETVPGAEADLVVLDLASLDDVRRVAEAELANGRPLHALINNAGVFSPPKRLETRDGFELQFGTNVLAHFALTCRLLPGIARDGRVVTVASIAHKRGKINFDDLQSRQSYNAMDAYAQSKLGDLMFAFELERRLREGPTAIRSVAVHPGVAKTNLFKIGNSQGVSRAIEKLISNTVGLALNDDAGGAVPTLFGATAPDAQGGGYYGSQGFQEMRGGDVGPAKVAPQAADPAAQRRLWDICSELTGVGI